MTPHQVLSLMTQDQTQDLMCACAQFLPVERIFTALAQGLEPDEMKALSTMLYAHLFLDSDESD